MTEPKFATFRGSSMVEQSAVNRLVVGSNPTRGVSWRRPAFNRIFLWGRPKLEGERRSAERCYVYIVENAQGGLYIGSTSNLDRRLSQHNDKAAKCGGSKYAPLRGPWRLVWSEAWPTRGQAVQRERQIKRMKSAHWIRSHLLNGRLLARRD